MASETDQEKRARFARTALPLLDAVYRFSLHLTGNEANAQDLAQECFQQAFRKFHQFQDGTNCKAWMFRIAKNAHIDRIRQRARQPRSTDIQEELVAAPQKDGGTLLDWERLATGGEEALYENFGDEVSRGLQELPWEFRIAVVLCDVEEFSYQEISDVLDCPVGTVRSRISRGRTFLKEKLQEYADGLGFVKGTEVD